jgi:hypothetical protein
MRAHEIFCIDCPRCNFSLESRGVVFICPKCRRVTIAQWNFSATFPQAKSLIIPKTDMARNRA